MFAALAQETTPIKGPKETPMVSSSEKEGAPSKDWTELFRRPFEQYAPLRTVKVVTACSGIEAPLHALKVTSYVIYFLFLREWFVKFDKNVWCLYNGKSSINKQMAVNK